MSAGIKLASGITLGAGITLGTAGTPSPTPVLKLGLDASTYTSGDWVDSVSGRQFTLMNGASYSSDGGGSIVFDASSGQYAYCASSLNNLSTWTIEAWHYYDGNNQGVDPGAAGACIITESFPGATSNINYSLGNDRASLPGSTLNGIYSGFFDGGWRTTGEGITLTAGNWYQIIGTFDGVQNKLYINNTLVSTVNYTGTPVSSQDGIILMKRWDNADYWGGKLGIVNVYEYAMDATGVSNNWFANAARFGLSVPGVDNVTGYNEFAPPIIPGNQTEDSTATVNGTTGITINNPSATGIALPGLTASNQTWFQTNFTSIPGTYTCTWGPGSTVASSSVQVVQNSGGLLVFYIQGQSGAATYNYPWTFSV